jgi:hypothetical protein
MVTALFLHLLGNKEEEISGEYYSTIDTIEQIDENNFKIIFDGVLKKNFDLIEGDRTKANSDSIIPHILNVDVSKSFFDSFFPFVWTRNFTDKWFVIKTSNNISAFPALLSIENSEIPEESITYIQSIEYLPKKLEITTSLLNYFSLSYFGFGNTNAIKSHLLKINPQIDGHKLNVYNVGQGSLTAVTTPDNSPIFYFDLGGAWWIFKKSYPITLRLCFTKTKTVIISHWDLDHLETARRLFYSNPKQMEGITWIAPKQIISPMYHKLAEKMATTGNLLFWSGNNINRIDFWGGSLLKCNGPEKNHNGISLFLNSPLNSIKRVLHPGDAAYTYIPGINSLQLDGLVATHHGANFDFDNQPIPHTTNGAIVYSHGNKYGHPTNESRNAHNNDGWINVRETPNGNISICNNPLTNTVPCFGSNCDLSLIQTF